MKEAIEILTANKYCTLATICEDGKPWATPLRFAFDKNSIYFRSPAGTLHGKNITNDKRVFVTIFDTSQQPEPGRHGAVYIESSARQLHGSEFEEALKVYAGRFEDADKLGVDAGLYAIPIGDLDDSKTVEKRIYLKGSA